MTIVTLGGRYYLKNGFAQEEITEKEAHFLFDSGMVEQVIDLSYE